MLVQIKNAAKVKKPSILVVYSNLKNEIASLLVKQGYLKSASKRGKKVKKYLFCEIAYNDGVAKLEDIKRVSKPSQRIYKKVSELRPVKQGRGLLVLSTPAGVMTGKQAKEMKVGGEALFQIW